MCSSAAFCVNAFQMVGNSPSIVPLNLRGHAGGLCCGLGEADSLCNPCQQRMQKHLPAVAEVQVLGM